jgi:uncharacterized phage protein (predicted DNA packaging)
MTAKVKSLLPKVKSNLVLQHDEDDSLLLGYIAAALDYAETYQKVKYGRKSLPPSCEQAIIMLASHWYESRDGSTGGFFADNPNAARQTMEAVHILLRIHKNHEF